MKKGVFEMELDVQVFGQRLRHHRKRRGLTLDELGAAIGRPAPFLSLMENGKREPRLSQISQLAAALEISPSDLLDPEPPSRRARLEIALHRAQEHPRYEQLRLPHLKATAKLSDEVLSHIVTLFDALLAADRPRSSTELRRANGDLTRWLRERDGYLQDIEDAARKVLERCDYQGPGPITSRHLRDIAADLGYRIRPIEEVPNRLRAIVDERNNRIYVAQRNALRTRQARKAVLQTLAGRVLGHREPQSALEHLRQRLESSYLAAAVLVPESAAMPFLSDAHTTRDISIEDLKEQFYVSYEMAAQRFTNLATNHFDIRTHFLRTDPDGVIWKGYSNDGIPLPTDEEGGCEGQRVCGEWGALAAFASEDRFDIHYQFTDTPAGSFWSGTHVSADASNHAITLGVRFEDARVFRGRRTNHHLVSRCPDGECCRRPPGHLAAKWEHASAMSERVQDQLVGLLSPELGHRVDRTVVYEILERHDAQETPSLLDDAE